MVCAPASFTLPSEDLITPWPSPESRRTVSVRHEGRGDFLSPPLYFSASRSQLQVRCMLFDSLDPVAVVV